MRKYWLEILLILAVLALVGQLTWPAVACWWRRPGLGTIGVDRFEASGGSLAAEFLIYLPAGYDRRPWPLVVFLHGAGERGNDPNVLRRWGPFDAVESNIEMPAVIVGPQCLPGGEWEPDSVVRFVEHAASTYQVDRERIYIIGYSMGGYGAWRTAAAHPKLFAAIVPVCGGGQPDDAKALAHTPVWAFHGAKDDAVPVAQSERMIEAIRAAGGEPRLTVIPDAGHGICNDVCPRLDLWEWLFEQDLREGMIDIKAHRVK